MSILNLRRNESPGKFEGGLVIDERVYDLTLEGFHDEETGDVSELGWFGLFRGKIELASDVDATPDERAYLASVKGAIVSVDNNGFVSVEYFDGTDELDDRWGCIEEAYSEADEEESEEDSEEDDGQREEDDERDNDNMGV